MLLLNYFTIPLVYRTHFINKLGDVFVCWHKNIYIESERGGEKEREFFESKFEFWNRICLMF